MFDIEKKLTEYGFTPEKYEELLKDCADKVHKVSDLEWIEIVKKYNLDIHYDTCRKASQPELLGSVFVSEYYKWKESQIKSDSEENTYIDKLKQLKDEIYKEKKKLYDQRREYNKLLTSDARAEHLNEELIKAAYRLNDKHPLQFKEKWFEVNSHKEAVMFWSDWHYGMLTNNIWNTYNTTICKDRVKTFVEISKEFIRLNNISKLNIVMLGDAAHGSIHTGCRIQSEEDACDQLMNVSEIMAQAINDLSNEVNNIDVYSCYGNHLRTIQDKKDSIHSDNMEKLIPWWLRQRLQGNTKIRIIESEYKEFTKLNVLGYNICCVHGDLDNFKNLGRDVNTIFSRKFGETIDYTVSGDKHHLEEFEQYDIESILIRSLCGTDDFANNKRLYSKPGQTLMIFNDTYGREATYHIPLDKIGT